MTLSATLHTSPLQALLSGRLGEMQERIDAFKEENAALWRETPAELPEFAIVYTPAQKRELEREVSALLERIEASRRDGKLDREKLKETLQASGADLERLCGQAGLYFDKPFTDGFGQATREFLGRIKTFDPELAPENIYQALRNLWIINSLQVLMGLPMACSGPMFAYSMLYPYSDNVNDAPELSFGEKWATNDRFRQWLEGEEAASCNPTEEKIKALVRMIENEFPRRSCPGVFQSLLGIFNAQIKSLLQQKQHQSGRAANILDISVEKGGTSVLADGYLIRGVLDERWEGFCFGYGVFLQFADDLQDLADDLANGHQTLYTQAAAHGPLDAVANKLFHCMTRVINRHLTAPDEQRCRELILKNCFFMVQEAICKTAPHYSRAYVRKIESHFAFSLPFYRKVKYRLKEMLLQNDSCRGALAMM